MVDIDAYRREVADRERRRMAQEGEAPARHPKPCRKCGPQEMLMSPWVSGSTIHGVRGVWVECPVFNAKTSTGHTTEAGAVMEWNARQQAEREGERDE